MSRQHRAVPIFAAMLSAALAFGINGVRADQEYPDQKVVYHNDGQVYENAKYFRKLLRNARNHLAAVGKEHVNIRVVDHGDGVVMLQLANADPELAKQIDELRDQGVKFLVCKNTLAERKIDWHTLYGVKEGDLVTSGVAELAKLQQQGFLYVHP